jgi:hypothetical protein
MAGAFCITAGAELGRASVTAAARAAGSALRASWGETRVDYPTDPDHPFLRFTLVAPNGQEVYHISINAPRNADAEATYGVRISKQHHCGCLSTLYTVALPNY